MFQRGEVISFAAMCALEGKNLQAGMHFGIAVAHSVLLMSVRPGAPYRDRFESDGTTLVYEGHDVPRRQDGGDPKTLDQPLHTSKGSPTQNGRFLWAVNQMKQGLRHVERVRVYEKITSGVWVYNGTFGLTDGWFETDGARQVLKLKLVLAEDVPESTPVQLDIDHTRLIPSEVKRQVWRRDGGKCAKCQKADNLHFDHVIPFSKGGSSLVADNIQLLCARHNLQKSDNIE